MNPPPGSPPIALGDHPGLARLLRTLPTLQVPVLPQDYTRIEQVFPTGRELPWNEARDLLAEHIENHWRSQGELAEALGITEQTLSHILLGRVRPTLENAIEIELLTKNTGKPLVRCIDWRDPELG